MKRRCPQEANPLESDGRQRLGHPEGGWQAGGLVPASLRGTISTTFAQLARKTRYPGIWRAGRRGGRLREASRRGRVAGRGRRSPLVSYRPPITSQQVLIYHHKASGFVGALVLHLLFVRHDGLARPLSWCFSPLVYVPRGCCTKRAASCRFSHHTRKSSMGYGHHILTYHVTCAYSCLEA